MILLIDIGNSHIKWNIKPSLTGDFVQSTVSMPWSHQSLLSLCVSHWQSLQGKITQIYVSSVAGQSVRQTITQWFDKHLALEAVFAQTQSHQLGVGNGYQNYQQLGVDRWLAILAAHHQLPDADVIVLDCGTAITFDIVTRRGEHLAGPIIPGKTLMINALAENTADIPKAQHQAIDSLFASNTQEAVVAGVHFSTVYAVRDIISQLTEALSIKDPQATSRLIVCGGGASSIMPDTGIKNYQLEADIVLLGLALVAARES